MNIDLLVQNYQAPVTRAIISIAGSQDGKSLVNDFWLKLLTDEITPPYPESKAEIGAWLVQEATRMAKKAANQRQKEAFKHKTYTENPPDSPTFGVISAEELWQICSGSADDGTYRATKLVYMRTIIGNLAPVDRAFLLDYQQKKARDLTPTYGKSTAAIWKRYERLRASLRKDLKAVMNCQEMVPKSCQERSIPGM